MKTRCLWGHRLPQKQGFTLVELMVGLVILAILLAIAVPSMREFIARKRVEGVAAELATDIRYLRAQQVQRGSKDLYIRFGQNELMTCYVLFEIGSGAALCDCRRADTLVCGDQTVAGSSTELKTVKVAATTGIVMSANPDRFRLRGYNALPDTTVQVSVSSSLGGEIQVSTNEVASPSTCSVSGHESTIRRCAP